MCIGKREEQGGGGGGGGGGSSSGARAHGLEGRYKSTVCPSRRRGFLSLPCRRKENHQRGHSLSIYYSYPTSAAYEMEGEREGDFLFPLFPECQNIMV